MAPRRCDEMRLLQALVDRHGHLKHIQLLATENRPLEDARGTAGRQGHW
jgi:hypothetical protein